MSAATLASPRRLAQPGRRRLVTGAAAMALALIALGALLVWRQGSWAAASFVERPMLDRGDIPAALAIGPDGAPWFTIESSDSLGVLHGTTITKLPKGRENLEPLGLAVTPDGDVWFTDAIAESIGHLAPDGRLESFPLPSRITQFGRLALAPDGAVWFADGWTNGIIRLQAGDFTPFPARLPNAGPFGVAVDPHGTIWATFQTTNQLVRIGPDGQMTELEVPTRSGGPTDVAIGGDGSVWFVELRAGKIGRFADGRFTEFTVPATDAGITGLAVAPDGAVWFTELRQHKLGRLRDGRFTEFRIPRDDARPFGIAVDSAGNVWYTDLAGWLGTLPADAARFPALDPRGIFPWLPA